MHRGLSEIAAEAEIMACQQYETKAAIYYLVKATKVLSVRNSVQHLNKFFTRNFPYPIIIFHESDWTSTHTDIVKGGTDGDLYFQQVDFEIPSFLHGPIQPKFPPGFSIGYRHMCRFHSKGVMNSQLFKDLNSCSGKMMIPSSRLQLHMIYLSI